MYWDIINDEYWNVFFYSLENHLCYSIANDPRNDKKEETLVFENQNKEINLDFDQFSQPVVSLIPNICQIKKKKKHTKIDIDINS